MKQLALDLSTAAAPTLENFEPRGNEAAWQSLLGGMAAQQARPAPLVLWGQSGAGKTHLLKALVSAQREHDRPVLMLDAQFTQAPEFDPAWRLIALDDIDRWDAAQQALAFAYLARTQGLAQAPWLVATAALPPADWRLRADLHTRLAQGLVFELKVLDEPGRLQVLRRAAQARGLTLSDEVAGFMLRRFSRDLSSLMALLAQLDEYALQTQRALTVPLLKSMLESE